MIELLVVIAIIGVLSTLLVYATGSARQKSRDNKRISDIKQIQSALDLYYTNNNSYPLVITSGLPIADTEKTYMTTMPSNPHPDTDGNCSAGTEYVYTTVNSGASYLISYCLGSGISSAPGGTGCAVPSNISAVPGSTGAYPGNTGANPQPECNPCVCGDCSALTCNGLSNFASSTASCTVGSVAYRAIKVGTQCWLDQNINIGQQIIGTQTMNNNTTLNKYCPDDDGGTLGKVAYCTTDGGLYLWAQAMYLPNTCNSSWSGDCAPSVYLTGSGASAKRQGLCPKGWHLPSDLELAYMENYVDTATTNPNQGVGPGITNWSADYDATCNSSCTVGEGALTYRPASGGTLAIKLKCNSWSGSAWTTCGASNLKFPLTGRWFNSSFSMRGYNGNGGVWSSSQYDTGQAWDRRLWTGFDDVDSRGHSSKSGMGLSVRCLKD